MLEPTLALRPTRATLSIPTLQETPQGRSESTTYLDRNGRNRQTTTVAAQAGLPDIPEEPADEDVTNADGDVP